MTREEHEALDAFIITWTCPRGGRHRVYRLCDCPGMTLDVEALEKGIVQVVPIEKQGERRR